MKTLNSCIEPFIPLYHLIIYRRRSEKEMNRLYATVCVSLLVICTVLYGISKVLQTYQNNESVQQPTKSNESNEWNTPSDEFYVNPSHQGKDTGSQSYRGV